MSSLVCAQVARSTTGRNDAKSLLGAIRCMAVTRRTWVNTRRRKHGGSNTTRKQDESMTRRGPRSCGSPGGVLCVGSCWPYWPSPGSTPAPGSARTGSSWPSLASSWRSSVTPWTVEYPYVTTVSCHLVLLELSNYQIESFKPDIIQFREILKNSNSIIDVPLSLFYFCLIALLPSKFEKANYSLFKREKYEFSL